MRDLGEARVQCGFPKYKKEATGSDCSFISKENLSSLERSSEYSGLGFLNEGTEVWFRSTGIFFFRK